MDGYMEHMVKRQITSKDKAIRALCIALVVVITLSFLFFGAFMILLGGLACFLTIAVVFPRTDVEYEYLYCDKIVTVDKIMGKAKRKRMGEFEVEKMEIVAPSNSYRLADYKNRTVTEKDFSGHNGEDGDTPYVIYYDGNVKIILDLPEKFVKMVQNIAPRKVFMD